MKKLIDFITKFNNEYQFRWLFYRNKRNWTLGKNNYTASQRCSKCKRGVSHYLAVFWDGKIITKCPHCGEDLVKEKNISFRHWLWIKKGLFWKLLDYLHICRNTSGGRYELGNEESYFVQATQYDSEWNFVKRYFKKRKWWEYIIIKKY